MKLEGPGPTPESAPELVCAGETMVMFVPATPTGLSPDTHYLPTAAGAESNVASWAAGLGVSSAWVSRVGEDAFGRFVCDEVASRGVDVSAVEIDEHRPTGVAFKEVRGDRTEVHYYRQGSAASHLCEADAWRVRALRPRVLHLTGITASLSPTSRSFARALSLDPPPGSLVSFDVNWRPGLWAGQDSGILLELARRSHVVFVGEDEAVAAWDAHSLTAVRKLLPNVPTIIVKQGARGAVVLQGDSEHFVPALHVDVVEAVGAGDAFAAGFLVGMLRDQSPPRSARLGTLAASAALRTVADVAALPEGLSVREMLEQDDTAWRQIGVFRDRK